NAFQALYYRSLTMCMGAARQPPLRRRVIHACVRTDGISATNLKANSAPGSSIRRGRHPGPRVTERTHMARTVLEINDSGETDAEVREWVDAVSSVMAFEGSERADHILGRAVDMARRQGARVPFAANTAYINTIPP